MSWELTNQFPDISISWGLIICFMCTVLWVGEREGGLEEEVPGDVWQPRTDEGETGRVTELPVRPTHSGGEPQKRPGNILYVMWMTYDWSALIYEVF